MLGFSPESGKQVDGDDPRKKEEMGKGVPGEEREGDPVASVSQELFS